MLYISLFGGQAIRSGTGLVRTRSARTLELVAFLAAHADVPQPRQRIAGLFWPESSDEQALTNLRRELHHLRQILGDDASLVVTQRSLCWRDTETCDIDLRSFQRHHAAATKAVAAGDDTEALVHAAEAVAQYHGEFMPGDYADWIGEVRAEREQQCVDLLDLLCAPRQDMADLAAAVDAARRRIQLRPLEEVGYRRLVELQGRLGDRAGAVSTYHHCASVLERELGVEPSSATRAALDRVMSSAWPRRNPVDVQERSGPAAAALIGREAEFASLCQVWRTAARGRTSVALVHGDPGVGKTRLVADLAALVQTEGAVVASAQCFGTSGRLALAPVADWLRVPALRAAADRLDPVWRTEVERLVPPASPSEDRAATERAMVDAWQRHRFFEGLARVLDAISQPLLLVLDNVQWCDQETLSFLAFCLARRSAAPMLLAGTLRDDDHEPALEEWISRVHACGAFIDIALQPLDLAGTTRLAEAMSGRSLGETDARVLQATTGGFPLYVVEAARCDAERRNEAVPAGDLTAVLDSRFAHLTPQARELAGLAAAVGRDFSLDLLTEAGDLEPDAVVHAVHELWRHRVLRESGSGYDFSHDLLRERAYAAVSPPRRWLLHRRIAQALELLFAGDQDAVSAQLAEQYVRAGRGDRAISYYRRAAEVATRRFAHVEAIRLHRLALGVLRGLPESLERDRQEVELLHAIAAPLNAHLGYSSPELREVLDRTVVLSEMLGRRDLTVSALVGLWTSQFVQGFTADSHRTAQRALALVEPGSSLSAPAHFAVAGSSVSLGRPDEALEHFALAATSSSDYSLSIGTRPDVHGRAFAAHAHWLLGDTEAARRSAREALAMARTIDTPYNLAVALAYAAITYQLCDDITAMTACVAELTGLCERYDFAYYREWGLVLGGWAAGDHDGLATARRGIDSLVTQGALARMPYWLSLLADLAERVGEPARARADLDAAMVGAAARDDVWWLPEVMRRRARYDPDAAAIERLHAAIEMARAQSSPALVARCRSDLTARRARRAGVPSPSITVAHTPNAARTPRS